jgi:hypothetical protein
LSGDPFVFKAFPCGGAFGWIFLQKLFDEIQGIVTYLFKSWKVKSWFFIRNLLYQFWHALVKKWLISTQHHVQYDTCAPDINFVIILFLVENFWCTKLNCPRLGYQLLTGLSFSRNVKI